MSRTNINPFLLSGNYLYVSIESLHVLHLGSISLLRGWTCLLYGQICSLHFILALLLLLLPYFFHKQQWAVGCPFTRCLSRPAIHWAPEWLFTKDRGSEWVEVVIECWGSGHEIWKWYKSSISILMMVSVSWREWEEALHHPLLNKYTLCSGRRRRLFKRTAFSRGYWSQQVRHGTVKWTNGME